MEYIDLLSSPESSNEDQMEKSPSLIHFSHKEKKSKKQSSQNDFVSNLHQNSSKSNNLQTQEEKKKIKRKIGPIRYNATPLLGTGKGTWLSSKKIKLDDEPSTNKDFWEDEMFKDLKQENENQKKKTTSIGTNSTPPVCKYGPKCYRKNPDHFKQWSHPWIHDSTKESKDSPKIDNIPAFTHNVPSGFTKEQERVIELVMEKKNVFFTGSAGTGKSTLLRYIIQMLPSASTFVTASTGVAAVNIGGATIHSFAGIGKGTGSKYELAQLVLNSHHKQWWEFAKVLIIDEISMINAELFEKLDYIAKVVRRKSTPFGGLQLICCGDFFQLPPVVNSENALVNEPLFCFESPVWKETIQEVVQLTKVFRQTDLIFVNLLNELRYGFCSKENTELLMKCSENKFENIFGVEPTVLYPHNRSVDELNNEKLSQISTKGKLYKAKDRGKQPFLETLQIHCPVQTELKLKIGCQVLLLKNINHNKGLVNGSRGVVVEFDDTRRGFPRVKFFNGEESVIEPSKWTIEFMGEEVASREQIPLRVAYALSIHKCQGSTITPAQISLKNVFEYGQAYVALSRVASLDGLQLIDFDPRQVRAHPKVLEYYRSFGDNLLPQSVQLHLGNVPNYATTNDIIPSHPFKIQYAASGRSVCKQCSKPIEKDELRVGKIVKSRNFDGHYPLWCHFSCFFIKFPNQLTSSKELEGFESLRVEDQDQLEAKLGNKPSPRRSTNVQKLDANKLLQNEVKEFEMKKFEVKNCFQNPNPVPLPESEKPEVSIFKPPSPVKRKPMTEEEKRLEKQQTDQVWKKIEQLEIEEMKRTHEIIEKKSKETPKPIKIEVKQSPLKIQEIKQVTTFFNQWKKEHSNTLSSIAINGTQDKKMKKDNNTHQNKDEIKIL